MEAKPERRLKLAERRIGKDVRRFTRQVRAQLANPRLKQAVIITYEVGLRGDAHVYVLNPEESLESVMGALEWAKLNIWEDHLARGRARGEG